MSDEKKEAKKFNKGDEVKLGANKYTVEAVVQSGAKQFLYLAGESGRAGNVPADQVQAAK